MSKFDIRPICRLNELKDRTIISDRSFVVTTCFDTDESYVYLNEGEANSDRVRSDYAKRTGSKFTNTRCRMLKNA